MKAFNETIYTSEDLIVGSSVDSKNIVASGIVTATKFVGDGSGLTNVPLSGNEIAINGVFYENDTNITKDYTITEGKNAFCGGPITIDSSVTVTVPTGSNFTVI
tara:strand:- start:5027 stop:5338 length:312 start_codon:yes stop_codon:yes gene_type:complete